VNTTVGKATEVGGVLDATEPVEEPKGEAV